MSFFSKILEKLGLGDKSGGGQTPPSTPAPTTAAATPAAAPPATPTQPAQPSAPAGISAVDVEAKLEQLAAYNPEKLNWRVSIVDLLKLLGLDSSLTARKELATELHCPAEKMNDSAQMNMWLHKTVLQKLAANGGKVPTELL